MRSFLGPLLTALLCSLCARAAEPVTIDVGLNDLTINKIAFLIAADAGIYARNGLTVHQFITPEAAALAKKSGVTVPSDIVRSGPDSSQIVVGGASPTIYGAVYKGEPDRVVVASLENTVQGHIVAAPNIRTIGDLRGKRLGYSAAGRANHIGLVSFARKMGWTPGRDITLVERASTIADVKDGRADAILAGAVEVALAPKAGLNDVADLETFHLPFAGSGINVERNWLRANRAAAARFVKSAVEAIALMKRDRKVFDAAIAKWMNIRDPAQLDTMYAAAEEYPVKPYPSVEGIQTIMDIYDGPEMRAHKMTDFYDLSLIQELDRAGTLDALYR